jgi:hypothetical protein
MPNISGRELAGRIKGTMAGALLAAEDQVDQLGRQLDHAAASAAERSRQIAVERAKVTAITDLLDRIAAEGPATAHASVVEAARRMRVVADTYGPTTPKLVSAAIRGGSSSPVWTVDTIMDQRVRLADGRLGVVDSAFGSDDTGVESITVVPDTRPDGHGSGKGDPIFDLSPCDVDFVDHR